jgi:glycosyltransferase involved in cell wall biosynthesis
MPKISILIPLKNKEDYLNEALYSCHFQSEEDWECLVFDDGSSDISLEIAEHFCDWDKRFKIFASTANLGTSGAMNRLIDKASGKFLCQLDADDRLVPFSLEKMASFIEENNLDFAYSDTQWMDSYSNFIHGKGYQSFKPANQIYWLKFPCALHLKMWRSSLGIKFDESIAFAEDWDFNLRAMCSSFGYCQEVLYLQRYYPLSKSWMVPNKKQEKQVKKIQKTWEKKLLWNGIIPRINLMKSYFSNAY